MDQEIRKKIEEAGHRAIAFRGKGFHCSESVFMAINETLKITDRSMVRMVTGFHGGGGTHRTDPTINLTQALEDAASGKDQRPREEWPFTQIGHLCGALVSGKICIGLLYGRQSSTDDLTCADELCYEFHRRFVEKLEEQECFPLFGKWAPLSPKRNCEYVYQTGAELAVEVILKARKLVPECPE
jgi:hypothetical protein